MPGSVQVPPTDCNTLAAKASRMVAKILVLLLYEVRTPPHFLWKYFQTAHVRLWKQISL